MATCSITDVFVVDAEDYYKAIEIAEKVSAEEKNNAAPPLAKAVELKGDDLKRFLKRIHG